MKVVIMAGGKGTRFWPISTEAMPKQFLKLTSDDETMLQQTYNRFRSIVAEEDIYIVVNPGYLDLVKKQLKGLDDSRIILEPEQRDTAPCIALAARYFLRLQMDEVIVTAPSDQYMDEPLLLEAAIREAEAIARQDKAVVTFGIVPTRAETGYGYIEVKQGYAAGSRNICEVASFIEKPSKAKALELIENPRMYWNSGIFIWKPSTIAYYMECYQPEMWKIFEADNPNFQQAYVSLARLSIDYAIMEKIPALFMIPIRFMWDDVGTWTSLERIFERNADGNLMSDNIYTLEAGNNIIFTEGKKTLVIGVNNVIIVSTDEGLLVCHKSEEQYIKQLLAAAEPGHGGMKKP
ncbi:mannose-1-phosphate guanylyltransferase [Paenibacillus protaetiae]|uniref:Mannose-1-phosphate guanylyltransferase n=1 Tax=Paenibacillus protaetiae TaxID=2509456 RepID=A0A4V0YEV7_9BACL|nr:sugar phosphate nucleotidyltransferase [Paenibacillus protaetiae]QAY65551.1 mannose-1-phosphate guanylyltransferase [Paenibacillus protaetiae]